MTLPLAAYFDADRLEQERLAIDRSPLRYVGHRGAIPEGGDYAVAPPDGGLVVVNRDGCPTLLDNVCAHRQARLLDGEGRLGRHVHCPVHAWSYRLDGSLRHAPGMDQASCSGLERHPVWDWQGLLFRGGGAERTLPDPPADHALPDTLATPLVDLLADLDESELRPYFSFDGYRRQRVTVDHYNFDWKIFVEVYLDLYHVRPFHPGLGRLVACDALSWEFGHNWSCQVAPFGSMKGGTDAFERWCRLIQERHPRQPPPFGALWLTIYPNTTVEWYPDVLVVSTIWPETPDRCRNVVEYFYPDELGAGLASYAAAQQGAYEETAVEDGDICLRMHEGKRSLWRAGREAHSPDHDPMELGIGHFHDWLRANLSSGRLSP